MEAKVEKKEDISGSYCKTSVRIVQLIVSDRCRAFVHKTYYGGDKQQQQNYQIFGFLQG